MIVYGPWTPAEILLGGWARPKKAVVVIPDFNGGWGRASAYPAGAHGTIDGIVMSKD